MPYCDQALLAVHLKLFGTYGGGGGGGGRASVLHNPLFVLRSFGGGVALLSCATPSSSSIRHALSKVEGMSADSLAPSTVLQVDCPAVLTVERRGTTDCPAGTAQPTTWLPSLPPAASPLRRTLKTGSQPPNPDKHCVPGLQFKVSIGLNQHSCR